MQDMEQTCSTKSKAEVSIFIDTVEDAADIFKSSPQKAFEILEEYLYRNGAKLTL
jgi:hypothetical protein